MTSLTVSQPVPLLGISIMTAPMMIMDFFNKSYRRINDACHSTFSQLIGRISWTLLYDNEEDDKFYD